MKRQGFLLCVVCLLCSMAVCAQSASDGSAQNAAADSTGNANGAILSEVFSKQFVLPEAYKMNTFHFELEYILYKSRAVRFTGCKFTSSITKHTTNDAMHANLSRNNLRALNFELQSAIVDWFKSHGDVLLQTLEDFEVEDSLPLVSQVYYSPILYAQPGDTLFCSREIENEYLCEGEQAATFHQYYVRNNRNTPYFALVKRHKNNVTLLIHSSETGKLQNILTYHIRSVELVTKEGNQLYIGEDGKSIRIKQVWNDNKLVSAEAYNSENKVDVQYEFIYQTWYPKLKKKDELYPNGSVKLRTEFDKDNISVTAFNEDGSKAKYSPAKGAEKALSDYFKKHFEVPAIGYEYTWINEMILKAKVTCTVADNGVIRIISGEPSASWSYNYKKGFISQTKINQMIDSEYSPYLRDFWTTVKEQPFQCTPAKMNGSPVASVVHIDIEHGFKPKYTNTGSIVPPMADNTNPPDGIKQQNDEDVVFIIVEQVPEFPGGKEALIKFLSENVKYPQVAKENKIEGRVVCQFVVDKDGTITDVTVVKSGGDASLDKEAVRVLRMMPKWKPGMQKGKPVRVKYTVPVNFKL